MKTLHNILCIETSIGKCSVALLCNGCENYVETKKNFVQSEQLFALVKKVLNRTNLDFKNLDVIACSLGPGSFTGIRIGIAAVQGMQKVLTNVKLLGVPTLELMVSALQFPIVEKKILTVLNASSGELYAQEFDSHGTPLGSIDVLSQQVLQDKLEDTLIVSEQSSFVYDQGRVVNITARDLLQKVKKIISDGKESSYENLLPIYVKEPNITSKA